MLRPQGDCPTPEALKRLLRSDLPEPEAGLLEGHLLGCDRCGELVDRLRSEDGLVRALRAGPELTGSADALAIDRLIDRLGRLPASGEQLLGSTLDASAGQTPRPGSGGGSPEGLDFLAAAQGPGELGRLVVRQPSIVR